MLEDIAVRLTKHLINSGAASAEDEEIYVYGWSLFLSTLGSFVVMFIIGTLLGQLIGTVLFLIFFVLLRTTAGGYHADTYAGCFVCTMLFYGAAILIDFLAPKQYLDVTLAVLLFIAVPTIVIWAPVDHPNKPFRDEGHRIKIKKRSCLIVLLETAFILALWLWQPGYQQYLIWAALGTTIASLSLLYVRLRPYPSSS